MHSLQVNDTTELSELELSCSTLRDNGETLEEHPENIRGTKEAAYFIFHMHDKGCFRKVIYLCILTNILIP